VKLITNLGNKCLVERRLGRDVLWMAYNIMSHFGVLRKQTLMLDILKVI
jgi:hypothetical protein